MNEVNMLSEEYTLHALNKATALRIQPPLTRHSGSYPEYPEVKDMLVWVDVESTGLDVEKEDILQIAVIVTNRSAEATYGGWLLPIAHNPSVVSNVDEWVKENVKGPLHDSQNHPYRVDYDEADFILLRWMQTMQCPLYGAKDGPTLCGNSVWFDRALMRRHLPLFSKMLHYRQLDVSSFEIGLNNARPDHSNNLLKFDKAKKHDAYEDIMESIAQYQHYLDYLK